MRKSSKLIISFLILLMLSLVVSPGFISAANNIDSSSSMVDVEKEIDKYIIIDGKDISFDEDKARKDKQSEFILQIGEKINEINRAYDSEDSQKLEKLKLPIWGNWCGPGHGGGPAKDLLDYACMQHDLDYAKYGYFDCGSDRRLINRIDTFYYQMKFMEKIVANAVKTYFKAQMMVNGC